MLKKYLKQLQEETKHLNPIDVLNYISEQYKIRIKGYMPEDDSDMILFQSGIYDWGTGENLEIEFARQLIKNEDEIWQLHITFTFPTPKGDKKIYENSIWLSDIEEINNWITEIKKSLVIKKYGSNSTGNLEVWLDNAE